jgi:hypothetical protein
MTANRISATLAALALLGATARAATHAVFDQDATRVAGVECMLFTASTVANAYVQLGANGQPRADDLFQTLRLAGWATVAATGQVRGSFSAAALADAPGDAGPGATTVLSTDAYQNQTTLTITFNDPAAPLGFDLTGVDVYILNIWSGAADWRNEYLLRLSYSTVKAPGVFIPLVGAFQRWEDSDAKYGSALRFRLTAAVTGVRALRLIDYTGNDGTHWRNRDQATSFNEIDVSGVPTKAFGTVMVMM